MRIVLTATNDPAVIKGKVKRYADKIEDLRGKIEQLVHGIKFYQNQCQRNLGHPGQKTGHNERDGFWANPCPVCGENH